MSRLEQMRQHFLQRVYHDQQQSALRATATRSSSLTHAKSIHNIPKCYTTSSSSSSPQSSQCIPLKRTASELHSISSAKYASHYHQHHRANVNRVAQTNHVNISRVKSLNNVYIGPNRVQMKSVNGNTTNTNNNNATIGIVNNNNNSSNGHIYSQSNGNVENGPVSTFNGKHGETKRYSTSSVNNNGGNNANNNGSMGVNRPNRTRVQTAQTIPSSTQSTASRRRAPNSTNNNNNNREELQCKHCQRQFAAKDRLERHVDICARILNKRRPVFNSSRQRLKEQFEQVESNITQNDSIGKQIVVSFQLQQYRHLLNIYLTIVIFHIFVKDNNVDIPPPITTKSKREKPNWRIVRQQFLESIKNSRLKQMELSDSDESNFETAIFQPIEVTKRYQDETIRTDRDERSKENRCVDRNEEHWYPGLSHDSTNFKCCSYCKRTFGANVIVKHETICGRLYRKKHFDV
ncbi:hypothetical protein RDWZM_005927 [Blomia tropicalis]|uniref:C2H2-type domain-containing protein n=1 Tax=Blomia tropicalis TaxID=40697 RepID=A0A9Q0MAH8_BLOTA|nr:hypothetical protein BLOT_006665 [Blomia tropicalis]KAJ6220115.1 hypothetical protein RDWZM_005927 [Blomia tropicalis]